MHVDKCIRDYYSRTAAATVLALGRARVSECVCAIIRVCECLSAHFMCISRVYARECARTRFLIQRQCNKP